MRGTFANVKLQNLLAEGKKGGWTRDFLADEVRPLFDAAMDYEAAGVPLVVVAGKMYGSGSSRDWAAKGPALLGIRTAFAESFERIHRSNLIGMGILPLQFAEGESAESLGLDGSERYTVAPIGGAARAARGGGDGRAGGRLDGDVQGDRARGHAHGRALLRERRHPALRAEKPIVKTR